jgi:hypothetical protein
MQAFGLTKICESKQLTPKYFSIKINGNSRQNRNTRIAATRYRIQTRNQNFCIVKKTEIELNIAQDSLRMCKIFERHVAV